MAKANYTEDDSVQAQRENICYFHRRRVAGVYSVSALRQITPGFSKVGIQLLVIIMLNKPVQL